MGEARDLPVGPGSDDVATPGAAVSRMRQAGDGSEFMEGWQGSSSTCYKCGGKGHWAKECTQQAVNMVVRLGSEAAGPHCCA